MRRGAVVAVLLAVGSLAGSGSAASPASPARAQVSATEFRLTLSRTAIHRGPAIIELVNFGEDPHDLRLRRIGGTRTLRLRAVAPGRRGELAATLAPGKWQLWCAVGNHRQRGMRATLLVRR